VKTKTKTPKPEKPARVNAELMTVWREVAAEKRFMDKIEASNAEWEKRIKRCACCVFVYDRSDTDPTCKPFVEAWDGKLFCPVCAFAVIPTGHCTLHRETHYPDVAAVVPRLDELDYPDEFVVPELKAALRKSRAEEKRT
jgi:hypothetical protein